MGGIWKETKGKTRPNTSAHKQHNSNITNTEHVGEGGVGVGEGRCHSSDPGGWSSLAARTSSAYCAVTGEGEGEGVLLKALSPRGCVHFVSLCVCMSEPQ